MQPLLNLKSLLAVLTILIVPTAILFAYFRNYSPEGGGHEHSDAAASHKDGDKTAMKPGSDKSAMKPGHDMSTMKPSDDKGSTKPSHDMSAMKQSGDKSTMEPGHDMNAMKPGGDKGATKPGHDMNAMTPGSDMSAMKPDDDMSAITRSSVLPGFPGVSRLYHIGATGFFLNHPELIKLTIKQQAALNRMKQDAMLRKSTAQRKIEQAEQELWELTGADEPDSSQIQSKVLNIEKLRSEQRMVFIQSVGEAATVLAAEQRRMLLGTMEPDASRENTPTGK